MRMIGKMSHDLTHIYLSDCVRITDYSMKALALCRNLNVVNVADCVR